MNLTVRSFDSDLTPEDFLSLPRLPVHVILDNLRSAFNVGSIIRTADCARIEKFISAVIRPGPRIRSLKNCPRDPAVRSLGSHDSVMEAVEAMKKAGRRIIALETTDQSRDFMGHTFSPALRSDTR